MPEPLRFSGKERIKDPFLMFMGNARTVVLEDDHRLIVLSVVLGGDQEGARGAVRHFRLRLPWH